MPELLIDFINQRSLDTIGDLIIEPGHFLQIPEEYLTNVKKVIKIKEINWGTWQNSKLLSEFLLL